MTLQPVRVVFDCMIYAKAMISDKGPSGACVHFARSGEIQLIWSDYVLREVRELPSKLPARLKLTPERVEAFIADIAPHVEYFATVAGAYENPFDADDSAYINLAFASHATLVISRDGHLLQLMDEARPEGRNFRICFPQLRIVKPEQLLHLERQKIS